MMLSFWHQNQNCNALTIIVRVYKAAVACSRAYRMLGRLAGMFLFATVLVGGWSMAETPSDATDSKRDGPRLQQPNAADLIFVDADVRQMAARIDELISANLIKKSLAASKVCTDEEFVRRAYLDFVGANPPATEVVRFAEDSSSDKRIRLIDELLANNALNNQLASVWADLLLPREDTPVFADGGRQTLTRWLQDRFAEHQRYDRIVGDLLIASGSNSEEPTAFFTAQELAPEKIASKTSRVFLGAALDCAQCHDHPFDVYTQKDFWGVAAYFAQLRSADEMQTPGMMAMTVVDSGEGEVTLPDTETIISPTPLIKGVESLLGTGSRRQQLAIWLTSRENDRFATAAVNRFWAILMGRGLIEPVDDLGRESFSSHPDVLEELTVFFRKSRFDIRKLMATIAITKAYSRSSLNGSNASERYFASMIAKPLTEMQLANTLRQISRTTKPASGQPDTWQIVARQIGSLRGDGASFSGGVVQGLVTQHSNQMEMAWAENSSRLLAAISAPHLSPTAKIEWIYLSTLARKPTSTEIERVKSFGVAEMSESEFAEFQSDLLWAILNSTEFCMTP